MVISVHFLKGKNHLQLQLRDEKREVNVKTENDYDELLKEKTEKQNNHSLNRKTMVVLNHFFAF